jgi:MFS transporter, ACS family, tartrate transporter
VDQPTEDQREAYNRWRNGTYAERQLSMLETTTITKAGRRILPLLFILYIVAYLDRANIAFAKLPMTADLHFSESVFGLGAGLFFLGYLILEIPSALIAEHWSARLWLSRILVTWGLITVLIGFVRTPAQFYTSRFLLGLAEAGFFPVVIVYLSHWFPARVRARAFSGLILAVPVSFVLGAPLSAACLSISWFGLPGWRWIFILQGLPAILLGFVTPFCLTDRPSQAKWLKPEERDWLCGVLARESEIKRRHGAVSIARALRSSRVLVLGASLCLTVLASYGYIFWLPTTIQQHSGRSTIQSTLLATFPFVVAALATRPAARSSDRRNERKLHTAIPLIAAGLSFAMITVPGQTFAMTMFWLCLTGMSLWAWSPPFWVLPTLALGESAAAASIGFINSIGNVGGFVGPPIVGYILTSGGSSSTAILFLSACFVGAGGLILTLRGTEPQKEDFESSDGIACAER